MKRNILELQNLIDGFKLSCQTDGKSAVTVEWYTSFWLRFRDTPPLASGECHFEQEVR
jgi:hypothetical protein